MALLEDTVTGTPVTGLTSPTYTLSTVSAPNISARARIISALGGTQTDVNVHSIIRPFRMTWQWPLVIKQQTPAQAELVGAQIPVPNLPVNRYSLNTSKGLKVTNGEATGLMSIKTEITIPAGGEYYADQDIRAALSAHSGTIVEGADAIIAHLVTGVQA
jgi:hypothetical protein